MAEVSERVISELAFGAFRYALGRQTHYVSTCCECIKVVLPHINDDYLRTMAKEIGAAIERGQAGHEMDVREWRSLLKVLTQARMSGGVSDDLIK